MEINWHFWKNFFMLPPELELIIMKYYRKGLNYRRFLANRDLIKYSLDFPHLVVPEDNDWIFTCAYHGWIFCYLDGNLVIASRTYCGEDYFLVDRDDGEVRWLPDSINDAFIDEEDMHWN